MVKLPGVEIPESLVRFGLTVLTGLANLVALVSIGVAGWLLVKVNTHDATLAVAARERVELRAAVDEQRRANTMIERQVLEELRMLRETVARLDERVAMLRDGQRP